MRNALYLGLLVLAVTAVAIADVLLRKAAVLGSMAAAIKSAEMLGAILLYLFQIIFFTYLFVKGMPLTIVSVLQTALYAIITIGAGVFLFQESLNAAQIIGIVLALSGVLLLNIK